MNIYSFHFKVKELVAVGHIGAHLLKNKGRKRQDFQKFNDFSLNLTTKVIVYNPGHASSGELRGKTATTRPLLVEETGKQVKLTFI